LCSEGSLVREVIVGEGLEAWPVSGGSSFFGLRSMAALLRAPIGHPQVELALMGRGVPAVPQMFMTDQF
jgi:hypothetical protein